MKPLALLIIVTSIVGSGLFTHFFKLDVPAAILTGVLFGTVGGILGAIVQNT